MGLFGTDGIRGPAGVYPIDPHSFMRLGSVLGALAQQGRVVVAKDTRISSYMLESALVSGLTSTGADVFLTGPLPTPALAILTQQIGARWGLMISASHNPYQDNGIKIFDQNGSKISEACQNEIEELLQEPTSLTIIPGKVYRLDDSLERYLAYIDQQVSLPALDGIHITLDLAHGAAYKAAPLFFERKKAHIHLLHNQPNGFNINHESGVLYPHSLEHHPSHQKSDFSLAFDGDADRLSFYIQGKKCDPHYLLMMLYDLYEKKWGYQKGIVGTEIHNGALADFCHRQGIPFETTPVGDRFLLARCYEKGYSLAGEPSGHYLVTDKSFASDALMVASLLIEYQLSGKAKSLEWYEQHLALWPSYATSLPLKNSKVFLAQQEVQDEILALKKMYSYLKILIRPSGTEPLLRLHIEGECRHHEHRIIENYLKERIQDFIEKDQWNKNYGQKNYTELETSLARSLG